MTPEEFRADVLDPARFAQNILRHRIWSKQAEILPAVKKYPLVAVKSCHASGKTYLTAEIVLWWLARWQDGIVITTSSSWEQVRREVWGEIRKALRGSLIQYPIPNQTEMTLAPDATPWDCRPMTRRESKASTAITCWW
jgi:hypothetical protein